ncbi:hypothetical protein ACJ7VZ_06470 [Aeromonas salmonicida]|jgi:hypothetical protein|uniref:hypothetical protein n=1 Tax=Aeromonas salmonicida TaxID=645 RepID=UPI0038B85D11
MRGVSRVVLAVSASITASGNGTAVSVSDYQGICQLIMNSGPTNAGTNTVKLQHSDDGSTNWVDVPNGAFPAVGTTAAAPSITMNADALKKFVRVVDTLAGGANAVVRGVSLVGRKQYT